MVRWFETKVSKIKKYYCENGLKKTIGHAFSQFTDFGVTLLESLGFEFYRKDLIFFEREYEVGDLKRFKMDDTIECIQASKEDVAKIHNYCDGWFSREQAIKRIEDGAILFIGRMEGQIVCYYWIEVERVLIPSLGLFFHIPEKAACLAYIFTSPEQRGRGIASLAERNIFRSLFQKGYRHLLAVVAPINTISQKLMTKKGFSPYQQVTYKRAAFRGGVFLRYYSVRELRGKQKRIVPGWVEDAKGQVWCAFSSVMGGHEGALRRPMKDAQVRRGRFKPSGAGSKPV